MTSAESSIVITPSLKKRAKPFVPQMTTVNVTSSRVTPSLNSAVILPKKANKKNRKTRGKRWSKNHKNAKSSVQDKTVLASRGVTVSKEASHSDLFLPKILQGVSSSPKVVSQVNNTSKAIAKTITLGFGNVILEPVNDVTAEPDQIIIAKPGYGLHHDAPVNSHSGKGVIVRPGGAVISKPATPRIVQTDDQVKSQLGPVTIVRPGGTVHTKPSIVRSKVGTISKPGIGRIVRPDHHIDSQPSHGDFGSPKVCIKPGPSGDAVVTPSTFVNAVPSRGVGAGSKNIVHSEPINASIINLEPGGGVTVGPSIYINPEASSSSIIVGSSIFDNNSCIVQEPRTNSGSRHVSVNNPVGFGIPSQPDTRFIPPTSAPSLAWQPITDFRSPGILCPLLLTLFSCSNSSE